MILPSTLQFLADLAENNDKTWFEAHKAAYLAARNNVQQLLAKVIEEIQTQETLPPQNLNKQVFRIYRDVRFSKNKLPYKENIGAYIPRKANNKGCDWYIHIQPQQCFIAGGLYELQPEQLHLIRQDIDYDAGAWRAILQEPSFKELFGGMQGEQLKTCPKGYDKDHAALDLLRYKQYLVSLPVSDALVCSEDFLPLIVRGYRTALPFFQRLEQALAF